jgi:threonine synthase
MRWTCGGCGTVVEDAVPLACPAAVPGDDIDHVLGRTDRVAARPGRERNPFLRYRRRLAAYALARSDSHFVEVVERLDEAVAAIDGTGFRMTPLVEAGGVLVKNETGNVSGSHKARHLMGVMLHLELAKRSGDLAIASCGNAALAAAVVARAAGRRLAVFIPPSADPVVVDRLRALECAITVCERRPGEVGDPTYLRFLDAVAAGALPFCCQGNVCAVTIEGGRTLGYELAEQAGEGGVDRVFLQVGGGAMASAVIQAFAEDDRTPRFHAVQTEGGHPLVRAWDTLMAEGGPLEEAARQRARFMRPWPSEPKSVAHGILDDETYDWVAVLRGMKAGGGHPVVVSEARLDEANRVAVESTGIPVDHTGSAGFAGLLELRARGEIGAGERCAVVFSGVRRQGLRH